MSSLIEVWVKAAVEHKTLRILYFSARTKRQPTIREVEPDFVGMSRDVHNIGLWAFCRLRQAIRVFEPDSILKWEYAGDGFVPNPKGRWRELVGIYNKWKLADKEWSLLEK